MKNLLIDISPLRSSPRFRRLLIGQALSALGAQMTAVAVMFQVWQATRSAAWTGAVGVFQAVPLIAFSLFAGSLVDRVDRRRCYLIAVVGQASCSVLLAVQGSFAHSGIVFVLGLTALQTCFVAVGGPASRTFTATLLPAEQVAAGLALRGVAFQGALLIGPAVGGLVLGGWGVRGCYLVDAVTFTAAFYGAFGLPGMKPAGAAARPGLHGVFDGLAFIARNRVVRGALLTDLAATALSMPISLFPLINAERFGDNPRTLGLFLTAVAIGGIAASLFSGTFTRRARPGVVMLIGSSTWGAALVLFGVADNPWIGFAFLALAGAADTTAVICRSTLVQLHTPDELRGRAGAAEQLVGQAGPNLGNLRGGLLASATSASTALISGGVMCVAVVGWVALRTPAMRAAGLTALSPEPAAEPVVG